MNLERMNLSIEILNEVEEHDEWFDYTVIGLRSKSAYCGTSACALGYIAMDERTEFSAVWYNDGIVLEEEDLESLTVKFHDLVDIFAASEWLDVPYEVAREIFVHADYFYDASMTISDIKAHHVRDLLVYYRDNGYLPDEGELACAG